MLYHAVDRAGCYRIGMALLDRENPKKVIARTPTPVLAPQDKWDFGKNGLPCVFPCANVLVNDEVIVYYGCGDYHISIATFNLKEAMTYLKQFKR